MRFLSDHVRQVESDSTFRFLEGDDVCDGPLIHGGAALLFDLHRAHTRMVQSVNLDRFNVNYMKAALPGLFSRSLVPKGVLVSQGHGTGIVGGGVVFDELAVLEDLPPLIDLALVGCVVMERQHNKQTSRRNLFPIYDGDVHHQSERATILLVTEVVARVQLSPKTTNKEFGGDVLDVVRHDNEKANEYDGINKRNTTVDYHRRGNRQRTEGTR